MATDVAVQYFNSNNLGLSLGNNWGDLIRLLDAVLVNGLPVNYVTGLRITAHNEIEIQCSQYPAMLLLQIVELSGFSPSELNQKYRVKQIVGGSPYITLLKPATDLPIGLVGTTVTMGNVRLSALGYEIVYRDDGDVKRVYRALNPSSAHPYIRVDETITSDLGSYQSTYAKFAMVGLHSQMSHIDDTDDPLAFKLPGHSYNYYVEGTGTSVVRGFMKWFWARGTHAESSGAESAVPSNGDRSFFICGDKDAFYAQVALIPSNTNAPQVFGAGLMNTEHVENEYQRWFLAGICNRNTAGGSYNPYQFGSLSFAVNGDFPDSRSQLMVASLENPNASHNFAYPLCPAPKAVSGRSTIFQGAQPSACGYLCVDATNNIRGAFKHVCFYGQNIATNSYSTVSYGGVYNDGMYIRSLQMASGINIFYLGEFER